MDGNRLRSFIHFLRSIFEKLNVAPIPDHRREVVLNDAFFFAAGKSAEQENTSRDASFAQLDCFRRISDREPLCAFFLQGARAPWCTVSVGVGFYDSAYRRRRDEIANGGVVVLKSGNRNLRPRASSIGLICGHGGESELY